MYGYDAIGSYEASLSGQVGSGMTMISPMLDYMVTWCKIVFGMILIHVSDPPSHEFFTYFLCHLMVTYKEKLGRVFGHLKVRKLR